MKLHFSITTAEELRERRGGRYVLYSVCLEGFLLGKARYSQLRRWDAQLRQLFGSAVPAFPPKYYLAMTKSMADERQSQLEQYLQNVTLDSNITNSDVFIAFFRKLQQDTFKIQTQRAFLDVYLADGSNIKLDIQTSDTAEQILEVTLCKMGLSRELTKYFSLFFFQDHDDGVLSVVKKVAEFELPYVSLQSMKVLHCKLGIRKWYMDPSLDTLLMDCRASLNLLYMQAIQEVERNWVKPTEGQMQELELLQKNAHKVKVSLAFTANHSSSIFLLQFLELIREMQFYGYVRLDPCMCDYPEEGCTADVYVGNNEINCCIKLPTNQIKEVSFKINRLRSWQVTFLGATKGGEEDTLEFRFEYNDSGTWQWIILYTKQAFLLSSCLKKMISEHMTKAAREGQEMVVHSGFISRKRFLVRPSEDDRVFEKIGEEDL
ncbi:sorting nexin-31 isoform X4 [Falco biarmicus]|uniref:sorting nexin-31 isoform X5 n=1 Tax=Falco rusticolus TaxID=120794 RepID=UPI0018869976|nr:sorting nexin-31 isoform X5 [Falco rusticolus]XP_055559965.1 sorting nexin-31 isoform X4 [Falco cherrug]XP_056186561.1 sorting nexin-31 isoform X4 [Falco biarmicus]